MTAETLFHMFFVFDNKIKFLGTHAVVLVKTFPLAYQTGFWNHAGTQISTQSSKLTLNQNFTLKLNDEC